MQNKRLLGIKFLENQSLKAYSIKIQTYESNCTIFSLTPRNVQPYTRDFSKEGASCFSQVFRSSSIILLCFSDVNRSIPQQYQMFEIPNLPPFTNKTCDCVCMCICIQEPGYAHKDARVFQYKKKTYHRTIIFVHLTRMCMLYYF